MSKTHIHEIEEWEGNRTCKVCWLQESTIDAAGERKTLDKLLSKSDTSVVSTEQDDCHCHQKYHGMSENDIDVCDTPQRECEHCTQQKEHRQDTGNHRQVAHIQQKDAYRIINAGRAEYLVPEFAIRQIETEARQQAFTESLEAVGDDEENIVIQQNPDGSTIMQVNPVNKRLAIIRANIEKRRKE